jgi:hypothetical protein
MPAGGGAYAQPLRIVQSVFERLRLINRSHSQVDHPRTREEDTAQMVLARGIRSTPRISVEMTAADALAAART